MKQIELAIENFKNQHGFYPPTFSSFANSVVASGSYDLDEPWASDSSVAAGEELQLLPFLNKISPNHRENAGAAPTPLRTWWVNIGRHLDDRSSLVFWLSGLSSNKQFPLTAGLVPNGQLPVIFGLPQSITLTSNGTRNGGPNLATDGAGNNIDVSRDSFFDFDGNQLSDVALDIRTAPSDLPNENARRSPTLPPGIKVYNTPFGDGRPNRGNEYLYRNSASYNPNGGGYHVENGPGPADDIYINPRTFQLFTYGRDGLAANVALDDNRDIAGTILNRDNITNFANGRLEAFDWQANLGL
jgi:hypothetical protein